MNREFYEKLCGCMEQERVKVQEPMAKHTTFRLGGTADYYVMPKSEEEIRALISLCKREEVPYYIVGNGSNLLVSDAGYRGVIIAIGREMAVIEVHGCTIRAQAGALIMKQGYIVVAVCLRLQKGDREDIAAKMEDFKRRRTTKQPLEYPSAGSTFKRPEGYFAGKLIQDTGLRGFAVGGAQVSEKHSGFVINKGGATAEDVNRLMQEVSDRVYKKFGVRLEPEVRRLGDFGPKKD